MQDDEGNNTCDYPFVFLQKAVWAGLAEYAPPVAMVMQRFFLEESTALAITKSMETERLGVVAAVCKWLRSPQNIATWEAWLPPQRYWIQCELGQRLDLNTSACIECLPGFFAQDQYSTQCFGCNPGTPNCFPVLHKRRARASTVRV